MSLRIEVIHTIAEFRSYRRTLAGGVGFVPTMGALHEGHGSLARAARGFVDAAAQGAGGGARVIASIFVNPTQFVPGEDYGRYPRTLDADVELLRSAGCDAVFAPWAEEMYPGLTEASTEHAAASTSIDPGPLGSVLEGQIRPGHFRGVCTVVAKLLLITQPTHLFMGQKDFQQQLILRHMIADLNMPVELVRCPTVREADGLAMSSRNRYLSVQERARAVVLSQALAGARGQWKSGVRDAATIEGGMRRRIAAAGLEVQYACACHAATLAPWRGEITGPCVLLLAAKLGATRLIDNEVLVE
jgi:pantoate--beta-alanine ligase